MPLKELAERRNFLHRKSPPQTVLAHALADLQIGKVALVSSFGAQSVVLLHMAAQINRHIPVIFLDTEMLFPETLAYQTQVAEALGLSDIRIITPDREQVFARDPDGLLHLAEPDACCSLRKSEPLARALDGFGGWITGRKRYQNGTRAALPLYEKDARRIKINPLTTWGTEQVQDYMSEHNLPRHPLVARNYKSIGCMPCTSKTYAGEPERAGRWRGQDKTECGIHLPGINWPGTLQKEGDL